MDREEAGLGIRLSPLANEDLRNIWAWNHGRYGLAHADRYRELLLSNIDLLRDQPHLGPKVNGRHPYRGLIIRRKSRGYGHIAFYRVLNDVIEIARILHTAQNWQDFI